jgi:acetolactate synthase regulatory subunit
MTQELQRDKTFEPSGVQGKLKIVLHDVSGTLIRALGTIERRGYDYRDVHCTQRVDGDFDLLVHIEDTGGPSNLDTLCKQLERLYNVVSAEKVGRRKHAERA